MKRTLVVLLLLFMPAPFNFAQTARKDASPETIADTELTPVAAEACGSESKLRSLSGETRTFLRFRNETAKELTYYWINYEGKRDQKRVLKPGETYSMWTYLTHPFVFVDAKGACAAVYMPKKEFGLVVITESDG